MDNDTKDDEAARRAEAALADELTALQRPDPTAVPQPNRAAAVPPPPSEDGRLDTVQLLRPEDPLPQSRPHRPEDGGTNASTIPDASPVPPDADHIPDAQRHRTAIDPHRPASGPEAAAVEVTAPSPGVEDPTSLRMQEATSNALKDPADTPSHSVRPAPDAPVKTEPRTAEAAAPDTPTTGPVTDSPPERDHVPEAVPNDSSDAADTPPDLGFPAPDRPLAVKPPTAEAPAGDTSGPRSEVDIPPAPPLPLVEAQVWDALPDLPPPPPDPVEPMRIEMVAVDVPPPVSPLDAGAAINFSPVTLDLAPLDPKLGGATLVPGLAGWERSDPPVLVMPDAPGSDPELTLPTLTLPAPPPCPPSALPTLADPLPLPAKPIPIELRPVLRANGGVMAFSSGGDLVNPPIETESWRYLDPFGSVGRSLTPEYINGATRINAMTLEHDHPVSVTFIGEGAGHRNTLGYYKIGPNGEIEDVRIIWENASGASRNDMLAAWREAGADEATLDRLARTYGSINQGGDLVGGLSQVTLDNLGAGDSFGFFLIANGFSNGALRAAMQSGTAEFTFRDPNGAPAAIVPGLTAAPRLDFTFTDPDGTSHSGSVARNIFHTAAGGDTLGLNSSRQQQAISGVVGEDAGPLADWGVRSGDLLIGFEDIARPGGDSDFNDIVFRLDVSPAFVESLETVSNMPVVTVQSPGEDTAITHAWVEVEGLNGAVLRLDGQALEATGGMLVLDGHAIAYRVEDAAPDGPQRISFDVPDGLPAATASRLLSGFDFVPADAAAETLSAGDRVLRFQIGTETTESDIVETVVRVVHDPGGPVVPPPATVIPLGPDNGEIARRNAEAEAWFVNETERVEAANAALAQAGAALQAAHADAMDAHATLMQANARLGTAAAEAEGAISRAEAGAADLADATQQRTATHAAAVDAHTAATVALAHEADAAARASTALAQLTQAHAEAEAAAARVATLAEVAQQTHEEAAAALQTHAAAQTAAAAAAARTQDRAVDLQQAEDALQTTADTAAVAHAAALAAQEALATAQAEAEARAEALADDLARWRAADAEARTALDAFAEGRAALSALDAARAEAHAQWSAAPADETARAAFEDAEAALRSAEAAHDAALAAWPALAEALEAATTAHSDGRDRLEATRPTLDERAAAQALSGAQAAAAVTDALAVRNSAAEALAEAQATFDAAEAVARTAEAEASAAIDRHATAWEALVEAEAAYADGPGAVLAAAEAALADDAADHAHAAAELDAAVDHLSEALAVDAAAEATRASALDAAQSLQTEAMAAQTAVDTAAAAVQQAAEAYDTALATLSDSAGNYTATVAEHRIPLPGDGTMPKGFLDVEHTPNGAVEGADDLFNMQTSPAAQDGGTNVANEFFADTSPFEAVEQGAQQDTGYDGLV